MRKLIHVLDRISLVLALASGVVLIGLVCLTFCDVTLRYLFSSPITGAQDLIAMGMVIVFFFALPSIITLHTGGLVNTIGHMWGYRNFESPDASTNIIPIGMFIGGEELHNNHHAFASSARFSSKWYEVDLGWSYISLMQS